MAVSAFHAVLASYHWQLSLYVLLGVGATTLVGGRLLTLAPAFKQAHQMNADSFRDKMAKPFYAANQKWNRKWGLVYLVVVFGLILPFCLTSARQPWWIVLRDVVVILMFYDFFYYLMHRFMFHNGKLFGGRLLRVHAVHHQQHDPCRMDASYIHPLEVAMGLGLYAASIFILSRVMGEFQVMTVSISFLAFSQINLHNHSLWESDRFPFRYLKYASRMHHNHHAKFTGGNFATITLLFDWMFGTLDPGEGAGAGAGLARPRPS